VTRSNDEIRRLHSCIKDLITVQLALQGVRQNLEQNGTTEEFERSLTERVARSETYLAEAQKLSHTGSWEWFVDTRKIVWSAEMFDIFGVNPAETQPSQVLVLQRVHPKDRRRCKNEIERAVRQYTSFQMKCRIVLPGGALKHLEALGDPVKKNGSGNSREYVGAVMDVTERTNAEAALQKLQRELAHVTRLSTMGELAASIAHEINQPLGAIVNNGNLCLRLLRANPTLPRDMREALSDIVSDGNRASAIVARVRAMTARTPSEKISLQLQAVVADVLVLARRELDEHGIEARTALSGHLPSVLGDRVQLQQVFLNLVMNGIEAMSHVAAGRRVLTICGERSDLNGQPAVLITVHDFGTGFRPLDEHRIFDAFYTTKSHGMGMGLSISRSIVDAHGGRLWAKSIEGMGTTFSCALPANLSLHR
jgi:C4-dicarboxylate-specific signal transduction histidine kinase